MGGARGRHGPRAPQVALPAEGRRDTTVGIRGAEPNHHACRWLGITVGGKAVHEPQACLEILERGEQPVPVCGENGYRLV